MFFSQSQRPCFSHFVQRCCKLLIFLMYVLLRFPKLTEQYFQKTLWPDESDIAHLVDEDTVSSPKDLTVF
jgi:hypothetical protein